MSARMSKCSRRYNKYSLLPLVSDQLVISQLLLSDYNTLTIPLQYLMAQRFPNILNTFSTQNLRVSQFYCTFAPDFGLLGPHNSKFIMLTYNPSKSLICALQNRGGANTSCRQLFVRYIRYIICCCRSQLRQLLFAEY